MLQKRLSSMSQWYHKVTKFIWYYQKGNKNISNLDFKSRTSIANILNKLCIYIADFEKVSIGWEVKPIFTEYLTRRTLIFQ